MASPEAARGAHLNLISASKQLFELDSGVEFDDDGSALLGAGSYDDPAVTNAVFRRDDTADPGALIARASEFFGGRGRGFTVWLRDELPEDEDLLAAALAAGLKPFYEMPEMICAEPVEERPLAPGAEVRRITTAEQAAEFWRLNAEAYVSLDFPPEAFAQYDRFNGLLADNVAAFLGYRDDEPASAAMTIVADGVAGIYWVGTLPYARGAGLGWATTAAAHNAGLEMCETFVSLQASPMGRSIYERMGYEAIHPYKLLMAKPPA